MRTHPLMQVDLLSPEDRETYLTTLRKVLDERLLEVRAQCLGMFADPAAVLAMLSFRRCLSGYSDWWGTETDT